MGSSPKLGFGWVWVLANGFKYQSELHCLNTTFLQHKGAFTPWVISSKALQTFGFYYFEIILDLQESCDKYIKNPHISLTQLSLMLTSYITIVSWSKPENGYEYDTIN